MDTDSGKTDKEKSGTIVGQLLHAKTESEEAVVKSRKVVLDEDGNKVIKVRKRKRVYSELVEDKNKKSSMRGLAIGVLAGVVFFLLVFGGFFIYRVTFFNSADFLKQKEEEISALWNAQVKLEGLSVEGFSFTLSSLTAEFKESSNIKSVEIRNLKGTLAPASFITGFIQGDMIEALALQIILRNRNTHLHVPIAQGENIWKFNRYSSKKVLVKFEEAEEGPFVLEGDDLYVRQGEPGVHSVHVIGRLHVKGWDTLNIPSSISMLQISENGIENINIYGVFSEKNTGSSSSQTAQLMGVRLKGKILNGSSIYATPLKLFGYNVPFSSLSQGVYSKLINFNLGASQDEVVDLNLYVTLPTSEMLMPGLKGSVRSFNNVVLECLPMQQEIADTLGNQAYISPTFLTGSMDVSSDGKVVKLANMHFMQDSLLELKGTLEAKVDGEISGVVRYGIPANNITRESYAVDPLFGDLGNKNVAWVDTKIAGSVAAPRDNTSEIKIRVDQLRKKQRGEEAGNIREGSPLNKITPGGELPVQPANKETSGNAVFEELLR